MNAYSLATVLADWHHNGSHWWVVFPILMLAIIIALSVLLWRRRPGPPDSGDSAKRILSERFARGEINADEYRERLAQL